MSTYASCLKIKLVQHSLYCDIIYNRKNVTSIGAITLQTIMMLSSDMLHLTK